MKHLSALIISTGIVIAAWMLTGKDPYIACLEGSNGRPSACYDLKPNHHTYQSLATTNYPDYDPIRGPDYNPWNHWIVPKPVPIPKN